ncbi:MAG: 1-acyl-sn-glycerol-3-phosphate acyltransferase [Neisseriaceae bacterium]|nr:1-acyl-sn-glycerol-3-phosphate acyltransferase [Neisseriaceae bacterium]
MKKSLFSTLFISVIVMTYFRKIYHNITAEHKNAQQIFALSHRNGAVDGWVYAFVLKNAVFTLAQQLHKIFFLRILFPGITLIRRKDISNKTEQQQNIKAFKQCLHILQKQPLCIFPEGTSDLGIKHLPFENGLSKIAVRAFKKNKNNISITLFAIFYDDPTNMGGRVFVQQGETFNVNTEDSNQIHQQMTHHLEEILLEYNSVDEMNNAHKIAMIYSVFNEKNNYLNALYQLKRQPEIFNKLSNQLESLKNKITYKKITIYPVNILLSLWTFLITVIVVLPTFLINAIPLLCGFIAGKKSKDQNTISLFKIVIGYWVGLFYYLILIIIAGVFYSITGILVVLGLFLFSLWGLKLYGACKKHLYAIINLIVSPNNRKEFLRIYNEINTTLS